MRREIKKEGVTRNKVGWRQVGGYFKLESGVAIPLP